jgi:hypothetical protein
VCQLGTSSVFRILQSQPHGEALAFQIAQVLHHRLHAWLAPEMAAKRVPVDVPRIGVVVFRLDPLRQRGKVQLRDAHLLELGN